MSLIKQLQRDLAKQKPDKAYDIRDSKTKGFLIRVYVSGQASYVVEYARGKRLTLGSIGKLNLKQAEQKAIKTQLDYKDGIEVNPKRLKDSEIKTFGDFLDKEYIPWFKAHRKPPYGNLRNLAPFKAYRSKKLDEITPRLIEKWSTQQLLQDKKPSTVKRYINTLKASLSKAVEWEYIKTHPLSGLKQIKTDDLERTRFLSDAEDKRLMQVIDEREHLIRAKRKSANEWRKERGKKLLPDLESLPFADYLKPIVLVAKNTGMRKGEILALRWSDVSFTARIITVRGETAKSSKTRHVQLNSFIYDVLQAWRQQSDDEVLFPIQSFHKAWGAVLKETKIKDFTFHDLRHDFASKLVMAGVNLKTIQELLGHADLTMTLRYAHLTSSHKAAAVEKLVK